jgi:acetyl-CoA carboxylase carboxyl transferase subunit alpha
MATLDFEKPIIELIEKRQELQELSKVHGRDYSPEIEIISKNIQKLQKSIFKNLSRWQITQLSRHPDRPYCLDYISRLFTDWFEVHGDRMGSDDSSMICGMGWLGDQRVCVVGQQKGRSTKEKIFRNFGMPNPSGYRKALRVMKLAERYGMPLITFIDTPGAFPGVEAEDNGQCTAISENLIEMGGLSVPTISVVIGEGGSGGALAIGVTDWIIMLEYSVYSVISPESCAAILWKDGSEGPRAAELLKISASDASELKLIDEIVKEPLGGAHRDSDQTALNLAKSLKKRCEILLSAFQKAPKEVLDARYQKWRALGKYNGNPMALKKSRKATSKTTLKTTE